jgi:hypothetical protein
VPGSTAQHQPQSKIWGPQDQNNAKPNHFTDFAFPPQEVQAKAVATASPYPPYTPREPFWGPAKQGACRHQLSAF